MKIIDQSHSILTPHADIMELPKIIEAAARTCYKSEKKITDGSAYELCKKLIIRGHEAMLEHGSISVRFITDRGVTHELVRHRTGVAFAQESTRYCNYGKKDIEFIRPVFPWGNPNINKNDINSFYDNWSYSLGIAEQVYQDMINGGLSPQEARSVLPNSLKTEIVVTANIREWRHIFKLRTAKAAHPQIRELMIPLLKELRDMVPVLFIDIPLED